jgi:redox-sensitive bicupin YhaK (pirin superfamily)
MNVIPGKPLISLKMYAKLRPMNTTATVSNTLENRRVARVIDAVSTLEGGGFPVRRPFPIAGFSHFDPFLLIDHLGPVDWPPGGPIGAPDHPHRGFETVTYVLQGENEHRDSFGNADVLRPGDVQWMTAGGGVIHSEMPTPAFQRNGGRQHGFQIWVNLPSIDKMMTPRYQTLRADQIPQVQSSDKLAHVRVIAGEALGVSARIDTRVPIQILHYTLQPGAHVEQRVPSEQNGIVYVFGGRARIADRELRTGQAALLGSGQQVVLANDKDSGEAAEVLLLSGRPIKEPVARYGPFVMNTREEIEQAFRDYQSGQFGVIPVRS